MNDSYFRPELKDHLTEYRKAVGSLTVYGLDQDKVSELEKEIIELRRAQKENAGLQSRVNKLESTLKTMVALNHAKETDVPEGVEEAR